MDVQDERSLDDHSGLDVVTPLAPLVHFRSLMDAAAPPPCAPGGPRMLIADDSYTIRRFLRRTFEQRGYSVDVATNGWHAFAQMQTHLYDFVFLDIEMPGMNGYRCAQALRKWEERVDRQQRQFICALTSHSKPTERELGIGIGMDLFESKPARPRRLLDIVEHALKAAKGDAAAAAAIAAAATALAVGAVELPDGAAQFDCDVISEFGADASADLAMLRPGAGESPFTWIAVKVEVKTGADVYDVEATDGSGLCAKGVHRRRLRCALERQPVVVLPGAAVDCAVNGAWTTAVVVAGNDSGQYELRVQGQQENVLAPRSHILALPVRGPAQE
ncbi:CheY-like superfamily [Pelagophyceae sp. CCMP2097]|nr:CheY-like superfamily [Pelagophyceae sp. CCMP2097]